MLKKEIVLPGQVLIANARLIHAGGVSDVKDCKVFSNFSPSDHTTKKRKHHEINDVVSPTNITHASVHVYIGENKPIAFSMDDLETYPIDINMSMLH